MIPIRFIFSISFILSTYTSIAVPIMGTVKDSNGKSISFASILVKKTTIGATANEAGVFTLNLPEGSYILSCQHVGYTTEEQRIEVGTTSIQVDFILKEQSYTLEDVIVKKEEDPAYAIIKEAIQKRAYYQQQLSSFQCDVYLKGHLKLRNYPTRFLGKKIDFEDGNTSKKKMVFLSESLETV